MTKRIKNLSVLAVAVLAGLLVSFSSVDVVANQILGNSNDAVVSVIENSALVVFAVNEIDGDGKCGEGKCGEGKCGTATKEAKKEVKVEKKEGNVTTEKKEGTVTMEKKDGKVTTTEEGKCGEGKCGGAEKKEGKAEKKETKTETKEGKCGTGKCGVA